MIRPTKYMDLETNILNIAAEVIAELQRSQILSLEELDELVQTRIDELARINFLPTMSFLYLTGALDYDEDTDAVFFTAGSGGDQ